jgi:hypothetical protein
MLVRAGIEQIGGQAEVQAGVRGAGHPHRGGGVLEKGRALGT